MSGLLIRWLVLTLAVMIVPHLISGVRVEGFGTALAAAAILAVLNAIVRPVLIILTLPLTIVTLGLFILIINALLFQLAGFFVSGLQIDSFWSALFGSLIVSLVSWVMNFAITGGGWERNAVVRRGGGKNTYEMRRGRDGRWE